MNLLNRLTADRATCDALVDLGIHEIAFFWWLKEGDSWGVFQLEDPQPLQGHCIPAWTKEEIDVMIGGDHRKPDLPDKHSIALSKINSYRYSVAFPDQMHLTDSGAQASALLLIRLIEKGLIKPDEAMKRYFKVFRPEDYKEE